MFEILVSILIFTAYIFAFEYGRRTGKREGIEIGKDQILQENIIRSRAANQGDVLTDADLKDLIETAEEQDRKHSKINELRKSNHQPA